MLRHRPVEEADLEVICSFPQSEEELFYAYPKAAYPLIPTQLQQVIQQRRDSTVVEREGAVVAFANLYRWEGGICSIGNVLVAPEARGQGVAQFLVRAMAALAQSKHDASEVQVSCFSFNVAALLLYTKLGFAPFTVEERHAPDGQRVALIHMRKPTDKPNLVVTRHKIEL